MEQCKRILRPQGDSMWSHLGRPRKCSEGPADANVGAAAVTPVAPRSPNFVKQTPRWPRYNPMSKLRWRKPVKAPHHMQKVKAARQAASPPGTKLNLVNPFYYIRRIKNKLAGTRRQRTPS